MHTHKGTIEEWNDAKGFGFIKDANGAGRIFIHISAFSERRKRPTIGAKVAYSITNDSQSGRKKRAEPPSCPAAKPPGKGTAASLHR